MGMTSSKDVNVLIKQAQKQGWEVTITKGMHLKWVSATGSFFFSACTPSDVRTVKNIKRDLRLNGFVEIKKKNKRR